MRSLSTTSSQQLLDALQQVDISVPLRTEGRTTDHCETWSICRFLSTFSESELLGYPLQLTHRDRPDFLVELASRRIGIEVTEVVPENKAAIDAYRENKEIDGPFFMQRHSPSESKLRGGKLRQEASSNTAGDGWAGDSVEREWVAAMQAFIGHKIAKAEKPDFGLFDQNWLLMYDNWSLPALDEVKATAMLSQSLDSDSFGPFDRVFVESSNDIWVFVPGSFSGRVINDIWAGT